MTTRTGSRSRTQRVAEPLPRATARGIHLTLCLFIDALGWELFERYRFLHDLLPVRAPLETVLGYSSACDPTILTGTMPRTHGHFSFYTYAPDRSPFRALEILRVLPHWLTSRARFRRPLSRIVAHCLGFTGYFQLYNVPFSLLPLFDYTERRDIYQPGGINGGVPTIFDELRARGVPYHLSDWRQDEATVLTAAERAIDDGAVRFAYVLLGRLDADLHAHGTDAALCEATVREYETVARRLTALARSRYRDVTLLVFSDHGMTNVRHVVDLGGWLEPLELRSGRDYVVVYDSTMARFWFRNSDVRARVGRALDDEPHGRVLSPAQLASFGCDFDGDAYGELIYLMNPGVLICPSFMGERPVAGMHGYDPRHPDSVAAFGASRVPNRLPRGLADLKQTMLDSVVGCTGMEAAA